eukprot:COSAG01_NODE_65157_length_274_cov_0.588571_1_plen_20_part_10
MCSNRTCDVVTARLADTLPP